MTGPTPVPALDDITPYKGGDAPKTGHKLSSNENPLGCSQAARAALVAASERLEVYPDGNCTALKASIAQTYDIEAEQIAIGAGSDEIFQLLGRAYLGPGDEIVQSEHAFLIYRLVAQQAGAATLSAPDVNYTASVDAMLERVSPRTKIVFLANPNNPTGTYVPIDEVRRLHAELSDNVLLVLDGAYAEYVRRSDYSAGLELVRDASNVVMTRTFSKIHGLAALRVGWAYGPASVIEAINKVRGPFNVAGPAQAAAVEAINDHAFVEASVEHNAIELARVSAALASNSREIIPSVGNFVLVRFVGGPDDAVSADAHLRAHGVVVRRLEAYGLPDCLRISIGTRAANDALINAFEASPHG